MNKDELKGKAKDLKGRVKEGAGEMTDNDRLEHEGKADQLEGQTQDTFGRGKRHVREAIDDAGERIKNSDLERANQGVVGRGVSRARPRV